MGQSLHDFKMKIQKNKENIPMKVHINRNECIECGSRETLCPEVFVIVWGEGSSIAEKFRTEGLGYGEVEDDLVDCVREAEENCPAEVISTE